MPRPEWRPPGIRRLFASSAAASSVGGVSATTKAPAAAGTTEELMTQEPFRHLRQARDALLRSPAAEARS